MKVIQIENLWKEYRLGVIGHGTLTHDLQSWWARVRGKEDPNSTVLPVSVGQEKQIEGDRFWALRDINLEVKEGEILGIIGKNGAGKSTLLKILSRVTAPTKGSIKVKGRIASLLEVGTGFHPELTGRENIFMNGAILGMSKQEIRHKLDEIIDFSGVEDFIDTPVKRYSSGMYVRLAFAVAAHLEPEILVVDEVLAVGDAEFQKKCLGKMGDVATQGKTVLFVSHNMPSIQTLCSKSILIENGILRNIGSSDKIIGEYLKIGKFSWKSDLRNRKDRTGNEKLKITDVIVTDKFGNMRSSVSSGDFFSINFYYESDSLQPLKKVIVYCNIYDNSGVIVFSCGNELTDDFFTNIQPKGYFCCVIERIPLPKGDYNIAVNVAVDNDLTDKIQNVISFCVEDGNYFPSGKMLNKKHGQVLVDHYWKHS